ALLPQVRFACVDEGATNELAVAFGVMTEDLADERVGVELTVPLRPEPVGDPDDARRDRRGALRHQTITGVASRPRRDMSVAVPTGPKSSSCSSTNPRRPVPIVTTASTRPASVMASA